MNNFRRLIITAPLMATVLCCKAIDIKGLVIDKATQEPLIGATIQLENSTRGAITDIDGRFSIDNVEKNSFIIVQYVSYQTQRLSVKDLGDKDIVILMSPNDMQLNEVTVVAKKNLEGERALLLERHKSSVAIESIGAKEMSLKGISNVEEGLKKITGISVASSGQIIVRGLGDRYSITTLNGMPIASPNPDNKLIPLDLFPASTVDNDIITSLQNDPFPTYKAGSATEYEVNSLTSITLNNSVDTSHPLYNITKDETTGLVTFDYLKNFSPTGISSVIIGKDRPTAYFDLEGRKVSVPQKGKIYITNKGQKIIF